MIGEGGASKVFLAEQLNIQRKCAIKFINKKKEGFSQLESEYLLLKQLEHVGIPRIYDVEEDDNNLYIIEEYICGETLDKFIASNPITEKEALDISLQICEIIEYLHTVNDEPIVYQDLKPDNILICKNNLVKIIDFGSATIRSDLNCQKIKGITPDYAAPEHFSSSQIDQSVDIYSIGKILEYIINNNQINISNSIHLNQIIKLCLEKSPKDRFPNIKSIISSIHEKLTKLSNEYKSKTICIIGSQSRIGTTYLSIIVAQAIRHNGDTVLIRENSTNSSFDQLLERNLVKLGKDCTYKMKGLYIQPASIEENLLSNYQFVVVDCGEVDYSNIPKADIYIFVMGTREWELSYTEKLIIKLIPLKNTIFMFNLSTDNIYKQIKKSLGDSNCIQIPYVKNPFHIDGGIRKKIMGGLEKVKCQK